MLKLEVTEWVTETKQMMHLGYWIFEYLPRPEDIVSITGENRVDMYRVLYLMHSPVKPDDKIASLDTEVVVHRWRSEEYTGEPWNAVMTKAY